MSPLSGTEQDGGHGGRKGAKSTSSKINEGMRGRNAVAKRMNQETAIASLNGAPESCIDISKDAEDHPNRAARES